MPYRRSRTDYPDGVIGVYDRKTAKRKDRYTVVYEPESGYIPFVTMNDKPFSKGGFAKHGKAKRRLNSRDLGKTISFKDLPMPCKRAVHYDVS